MRDCLRLDIRWSEVRTLRPGSAKWWIGTALGTNLVLAAIIFAVRGSGVHGTLFALAATARVAFLWFFCAYAGGALAALFGPAFLPLKLLGRELGLAFAAALLVHLALVSWLCWIGEPPPIGVFVFFGSVAVITYTLAILSFGNLHLLIGSKWWRLLRTIGMNVILYAFFTDFLQHPFHGGIRHLIEYLPFATMAAAAFLLRITAWTLGLKTPSRPVLPANRNGERSISMR
jgi:hypothetical protein